MRNAEVVILQSNTSTSTGNLDGIEELHASLLGVLSQAKELGRTLTWRVHVRVNREPWWLCGVGAWAQGLRFAWRGDVRMAALGQVSRCVVEGPSRFDEARQVCQRWAQELVEDVVGSQEGLGVAPLAWAGFGFSAAPEGAGPWAQWPAGELVLPALMLWQREGESCWASMAWSVSPDDTVDGLWERVEASWSVVRGLAPPALTRGHKALPFEAPAGDKARWCEAVEHARRSFAESNLEKVVLARQVEVGGQGQVAPLETLWHLREHHQNGYLFLLGDEARGDFLGATPERLVRVQGRTVETCALAGTARRSENHEEDKALGLALMASAKDQHEHALVARAIDSALRPLCESLELAKSPKLRRLPRVQHLETVVRGELHQQAHVLDLVGRLHPTPAVGGWPRPEALAWLEAHEGLARGWYAAPVGWVDGQGGGSFAVAIRSALVSGGQSFAFAGAGLVPDSEAEREWEETRLKLRTIAEALVLRASEDV